MKTINKMALLTELQNQLWTTIQRLQSNDNVMDESLALQTGGPYTIIPSMNDNGNSSNNDNPKIDFQQLTQNYSQDGFEALDFEFTCYNQQSIIGHLITMILYSIVCIVGLFGNTLVIYVVLRFSKMQTVTNIYILNLAFADECFLIGIPFLLYTMQKGSWQFGEFMCKAYMVSTSITQFTSSIFLLIMAADRYIAVCHPISSPRFRTPIVSKIVSCLAWIMSALLMLPVMLFANSVQTTEDHVSCNIKWPEAHNTHSDSTFIWYTLFLGFATPLTFIMIFYCLVIRKLHSVELKHKSKEKKRSHRKVTKLVLTVIAVYILCWLPYWIAQLVLINTNAARCASALEILAFLLVGCLGYSNSAMNPLLYAFLSDNFKKSFLRAFSCTGLRKDGFPREQHAERSILPKWSGSKRRSHSRGDTGADESGYDDGNVRVGGGGGGGYGTNNSGDVKNGNVGHSSRKSRKSYCSNTSRFLGTSTAGGTGITATSFIDDDDNSDSTPMDNLIEANAELLHNKCSYGNVLESHDLSSNAIDNVILSVDFLGQPSQAPVLQTDL